MRLIDKIKRLEKYVHKNDEPLGIAVRYLNGKVLWNDRIWEDEKTFNGAVDDAFKDSPPTGAPRIIVITYHRELPVTPRSLLQRFDVFDNF
jgi:hypothetical protein